MQRAQKKGWQACCKRYKRSATYSRCKPYACLCTCITHSRRVNMLVVFFRLTLRNWNSISPSPPLISLTNQRRFIPFNEELITIQFQLQFLPICLRNGIIKKITRKEIISLSLLHSFYLIISG